MLYVRLTSMDDSTSSPRRRRLTIPQVSKDESFQNLGSYAPELQDSGKLPNKPETHTETGNPQSDVVMHYQLKEGETYRF
ncbi:hypothetical protein XPA_007440 [Xanthoria parietina]